MRLNQLLQTLLSDYFPGRQEKYTHKQLNEVGEKLGKVALRKPYQAQYLVNILNQNYGEDYSSLVLEKAINIMGMRLDGVGVLGSTHTQPVKIYAEPGAIKDGAVILGKSKVCASPSCRIVFVPRVPHARACSPECAREIRNIRRRRK